MPKTMKKAQQMRTMLPMGLSDVIRVSTTSFSPGARLITLERQHRRLVAADNFFFVLAEGPSEISIMGKKQQQKHLLLGFPRL